METLNKSKFKAGKELQKLGFSFGFAVLMYQLVYGVFSTYISYWLTDLLKISAANAGTVISVGGIFDTIGVVIVGFIVQNTNFKWGKYRSWLRFMPIVFSAAYVLIFISWKGNETFVTALMIILYIIGGTATNFLLLSARGLEAKAGKTQQGRVFLTGRDGLFMTIGRAIYGATFLWFVATIGQGNDNTGYLVYFIIFGIINIAAWYILFRVTRNYETADDIAAAKAELATTKLGLKSTWEALAKNPQFLAFFISETVMDIGIMVSYMTMVYYFTYVVGDMKYMALYLTTSTLTGILGTYLGPHVCRFISKKTAFVISQVGYFLGFGACYLQFLFTGHATGMFFLISVNIGIVIFNFQNAFKNSLYMDCAEYGFHRNGKETMPFLMALSNFPFKIAVAAGGAIIGVALTAAGYTAGMESTPQIVNSLCNITLLLPSACIGVGALILGLFYKLTNKRMDEIMAANALKKAEMGIKED